MREYAEIIPRRKSKTNEIYKDRMTCRRPDVSTRGLLYKDCRRPNLGMVKSDRQ